MPENLKLDEADDTFESLIHLSPGLEASTNFHQRNPHTELGKSTTDELGAHLQEAIEKKSETKQLTDFNFFVAHKIKENH